MHKNAKTNEEGRISTVPRRIMPSSSPSPDFCQCRYSPPPYFPGLRPTLRVKTLASSVPVADSAAGARPGKCSPDAGPGRSRAVTQAWVRIHPIVSPGTGLNLKLIQPTPAPQKSDLRIPRTSIVNGTEAFTNTPTPSGATPELELMREFPTRKNWEQNRRLKQL